MLNIVIPMAGRGSRFIDAGYTTPKPFIPIHGQRMIEVVLKNLAPKSPHRFVVLCLQDHIDEQNLEQFFYSRLGQDNVIIVPVNTVTEGAACTVLLAKEHINNDEPLMIANSDQWVDINIDDYISQAQWYNGMIMTMKAHDPKWSYVRFGAAGVIEVVEKQVVSDEATVGIYNFQHGSDFVRAAERMIEHNLRVNGEFYVAPVYNQLIAEGYRIGIYNVGEEANGMYGLGTPVDLQLFCSLPVSIKAVNKVLA